MIKKFIKLLLYFLILIAIGIVYLSYFGIETKRFNQLIRDEISESNKKIDIELKDVKIILNLLLLLNVRHLTLNTQASVLFFFQ